MYRDIESDGLLAAVVKVQFPSVKNSVKSCSQRCPKARFICTRPNNHDGPHVAHTGVNYPIAMWDAS